MSIPGGTKVSLKGKSISTKSSEESQWLYLILNAIYQLSGNINNVFTHTPAAFTVGTTAGAPVNGQSAWTISTINVISKNPVFLKNGIPLTSGTNYTFNNSTGTFTLATGTFATGETYTVLY